jgi:RNA-directed DNA polymerase
VDGKTKLARHDEVAIVRHAKVQGKRSPLDPDDQAYWEARQRRRLEETMRSRKRAVLLRQQDYRCAMCGVWFDPDQDISLMEAHHDTPRHRGGTDRTDNLRLVHRWCHKAHHARTVRQAAEA